MAIKIWGNGLNQSDLFDLMDSIRTKWNATMALLDADAGIAAEDYVATYTISWTDGVKDGKGMSEAAIINFLQTYVDYHNLVCAILDADNLQLSNYVSGCGITDVVRNTAGQIKNGGLAQGNLVKLLDTIITKMNALTAKLLADTTVQGTTYVSANTVTDVVEASGCSNS